MCGVLVAHTIPAACHVVKVRLVALKRNTRDMAMRKTKFAGPPCAAPARRPGLGAATKALQRRHKGAVEGWALV